MSERKALLILHGKQALNEAVRTAVEEKRQQGWDLAVRVTWEAGDAQRLVDEALDAGYVQIIAGGGDGTLRDIAEAIANHSADASLVLMPLGTANDFARAAGVPLEPGPALELLDAPASAIDLGEAGSQVFLNMATGGFGSQVTANTSEDLKKCSVELPICLPDCRVSASCTPPTASCRGLISNGKASSWHWASAMVDRPVAATSCAPKHWLTMVCLISAFCLHPRKWSAP